jgi:hypothetical protein
LRCFLGPAISDRAAQWSALLAVLAAAWVAAFLPAEHAGSVGAYLANTRPAFYWLALATLQALAYTALHNQRLTWKELRAAFAGAAPGPKRWGWAFGSAVVGDHGAHWHGICRGSTLVCAAFRCWRMCCRDTQPRGRAIGQQLQTLN